MQDGPLALVTTTLLHFTGPKLVPRSKIQVAVLIILFNLPAFSFEVISHKGMHNEECLQAGKICRADCLTWNNNYYFENTIPAIKEAFRLGANRIEIDLRMTKDKEIILYHDADLYCRTGHKAHVSQVTLNQLKNLDVGNNLKFLNIPHNPLKNKGIGLIPTLKDVLRAFPHKKFFLNPKVSSLEFRHRLNQIFEEVCLKEKKCNLNDFSMWGPWINWHSLKSRFPDFGERFTNAFAGNSCEIAYQMWGWSGYFPEQCKNLNMVYSIERINTWNTWGWPTELIQRFHKNQSKIYLIHVKSKNDLILLRAVGADGIITSRMGEML